MPERPPGKPGTNRGGVSLHPRPYFITLFTWRENIQGAITLKVDGSLPRVPPHSGISVAGGMELTHSNLSPIFSLMQNQTGGGRCVGAKNEHSLPSSSALSMPHSYDWIPYVDDPADSL